RLLSTACVSGISLLHDVKTTAVHAERRNCCSLSLGRFHPLSGGARRDRTDDLLLAKQALSQLSYGPFKCQRSVASPQEAREPRPSNLSRPTAILITDTDQ